jgi:hypothetical protein
MADKITKWLSTVGKMADLSTIALKMIKFTKTIEYSSTMNGWAL